MKEQGKEQWIKNSERVDTQSVDNKKLKARHSSSRERKPLGKQTLLKIPHCLSSRYVIKLKQPLQL